MWPAILIVILLIVAAGLLPIWLRLRTRFTHGRRQTSMQSVWQSWRVKGDLDETRHAEYTQLWDGIDDAVRESVYKSLLEFESGLQAAAQPMLTVRNELMDSIDRRQLNTEILNLPEDARANLRNSNREIVQTDAAACTYIIANELRMAVLREYARRRYADCADGDWFDVYQKASRLRQRSTRHYIERTLGGNPNPSDEARFQSMSLVDREIRARLLRVPAGTRFPGFGKTVERGGEPA